MENDNTNTPNDTPEGEDSTIRVVKVGEYTFDDPSDLLEKLGELMHAKKLQRDADRATEVLEETGDKTLANKVMCGEIAHKMDRIISGYKEAKAEMSERASKIGELRELTYIEQTMTKVGTEMMDDFLSYLESYKAALLNRFR